MTQTLTSPNIPIISKDREAIKIAQELAAQFSQDSGNRDRQRRLPHAELKKLAASGLWGITVPREYGGAFVSKVALAEVIAIMAAADASIGQISLNHYYMVEAIRLNGTKAQKQYFFQLVLEGKLFGKATYETVDKSSLATKTRLSRQIEGYILNGKKHYSTGALFADILPVFALDEDDEVVVVFVDRRSHGLMVVDDWSGIGQRTTASGTTFIDNVKVREQDILHNYLDFAEQRALEAVSQVTEVAVEVGIARAAAQDTITFIRAHIPSTTEAALELGYEAPLILHNIGEIQIKLHAAEALLQRAGELLDRAIAQTNETHSIEAEIAVAEAKAIADQASMFITNKLFELGGTKSSLEEFNHDRHWRNARALNLQNPVRRKYYTVGNYYLNAKIPRTMPGFKLHSPHF